MRESKQAPQMSFGSICGTIAGFVWSRSIAGKGLKSRLRGRDSITNRGEQRIHRALLLDKRQRARRLSTRASQRRRRG